MSSQRLNVEIVRFSRENEKCNNSNIWFRRFQVMIQSSQRFDEYIGSFIAKLITSGNEKVQSFVKIKIKMSAEEQKCKFNVINSSLSFIFSCKNRKICDNYP